jgi:hypothetical protein
MADKIHVYICVFAAFITAVVSAAQSVSIAALASRLIIVICLFYVIGLIARAYVKKVIRAKEDVEREKTSPE